MHKNQTLVLFLIISILASFYVFAEGQLGDVDAELGPGSSGGSSDQDDNGQGDVQEDQGDDQNEQQGGQHSGVEELMLIPLVLIQMVQELNTRAKVLAVLALKTIPIFSTKHAASLTIVQKAMAALPSKD